jgi:hypothetical protein
MTSYINNTTPIPAYFSWSVFLNIEIGINSIDFISKHHYKFIWIALFKRKAFNKRYKQDTIDYTDKSMQRLEANRSSGKSH